MSYRQISIKVCKYENRRGLFRKYVYTFAFLWTLEASKGTWIKCKRCHLGLLVKCDESVSNSSYTGEMDRTMTQFLTYE